MQSKAVFVNKKRRSYTRCAYCCKYRSPNCNRKFFTFPTNEELSKKWVAICNRKYLLSKTVSQLHKSYQICSDHFQKSDYRTDKMHYLKPEAFPRYRSSQEILTNLAGGTTLNAFCEKSLFINIKQSLRDKFIMSGESSSNILQRRNVNKPEKQDKPHNLYSIQTPEEQSLDYNESDDVDDDLEIIKPLNRSPTDDEIYMSIQEIIHNANFEDMTLWNVIDRVDAQYSNFDLTSRHTFMKECVRKIIMET